MAQVVRARGTVREQPCLRLYEFDYVGQITILLFPILEVIIFVKSFVLNF